MRRRTKVLIGSAVALVLIGGTAAIAGPIVYRDLIAKPADAVPTISAGPGTLGSTPTGRLSAADVDGAWSVGSGSEAGYRVNEVLNGTDVTVTGRTSEVTGSLTVQDLTLTKAELSVDVASIATDSQNRDDYFRTTALRTDRFPKATFVLTKAAKPAAAPKAGETVKQSVTGDLTLAGKTRSVTFEVEVRSDSSQTQIAGQIPITFADYGVEAPSLGFVKVEPKGFVEFQLLAHKG